MPSQPITVTIAGDDSQLNAILAKALANIKTFGAESGTSGEKMTRSFHEARGSVALLNEELGTHLSRHLRTIIASSQFLGPALELAFPIAAAVGFYEVLDRIGKKLGDWYFGNEALKQFEETVKSTTEHLIKLSDETRKLDKETAETGASSQQKWSIALGEATEKVKRQKAALRDLSDLIYSLGPNGFQTNVAGNTAADIPTLKEHEKRLAADLTLSVAEQAHAQAELNVAQRAGMDEYNKKLEEAKKKAEEFKKELQAISRELSQQPLFFSQQSLARVRNLQNPLGLNQQNPLESIPAIDPGIQGKYLQRFKDLQGVLEATRRPAELLAISIQNLNDLFKGDTTSEVYKRALENIKDRYDEARQAAERFGQEVGHALAEGILMGRSWKNVLDSLIIAFAQLIVKMYLLKALQDSSFGSSKIGGFFTSLVSGFGGGKAGGGPVSGGMPYLVGEQGPEIFMPNTSGSIVPNGKWGRGGDTYIIDARGADMGVEQKIIAAMEFTRKQAVAQAVGIVRENSLRGRG